VLLNKEHGQPNIDNWWSIVIRFTKYYKYVIIHNDNKRK